MRLLWLLAAFAALGQAVNIRVEMTDDAVLQGRLERVAFRNEERCEIARKMLEEAGCSNLRLQPAKGKWNNVVCTLPGETDEVVIVGAHFDHAGVGKGSVDNWGGLTMLPGLYEALAKEKRRFTFLFVAFAEEEKGMVGAHAFVKQLGKEGLAKVHAMVNIDSIGMNPPKLWVSRSDKRLVTIAAAVGRAFESGLQGVDVEQVGDSDSRPFAAKKVPVLDVHSLTQESFPVLHSKQDVPEAIKFEHYKTTYRLVAGVLLYLDAAFDRYKTPAPQK